MKKTFCLSDEAIAILATKKNKSAYVDELIISSQARYVTADEVLIMMKSFFANTNTLDVVHDNKVENKNDMFESMKNIIDN